MNINLMKQQMNENRTNHKNYYDFFCHQMQVYFKNSLMYREKITFNIQKCESNRIMDFSKNVPHKIRQFRNTDRLFGMVKQNRDTKLLWYSAADMRFLEFFKFRTAIQETAEQDSKIRLSPTASSLKLFTRKNSGKIFFTERGQFFSLIFIIHVIKRKFSRVL